MNVKRFSIWRRGRNWSARRSSRRCEKGQLFFAIVYQGYGNGVDIGWIKQLGRFATGGVTPDLTLFFDIDAKKGLGRISRPKDRIERRSILYHNRVRTGYRTLARQEPRRIKLVKVDGGKEEIQ